MLFNDFTNQILTWLGIFISVYLVYYGYKFQASKASLEKQLYNVYLPLFRLLEEYIGKKTYYLLPLDEIKNIISEIDVIIDKHYELVHPTVVHSNRLLAKEIEESMCITPKANQALTNICSHVEKGFERTRKRMYYPYRNAVNRISSSDERNELKQLLLFIFTSLPQIIFMGAISYLLALLFKLLSQ